MSAARLHRSTRGCHPRPWPRPISPPGPSRGSGRAYITGAQPRWAPGAAQPSPNCPPVPRCGPPTLRQQALVYWALIVLVVALCFVPGVSRLELLVALVAMKVASGPSPAIPYTPALHPNPDPGPTPQPYAPTLHPNPDPSPTP